MMEHLINIEETVNPANPNLVQRINENVNEVPPLHPESCIYKVHEGLRKVKPKAYEPMLVSIGPYHLQNTRLHAMKKHKLLYLHSLLERRNEKSVERYVLEMTKLEGRARNCYSDPIDIKSSDEFVEMMLLDGCFIIEFLRKGNYVPWMHYQICRDIMLLENQLPYFVLSQLYDMTKALDERPLMEMAMMHFNDILPKPHPNFNHYVGRNHTHGINHLLHVVHILCCPLSEETITESSNNDEILDETRHLSEERSTKNSDSDSDSDNDEILDETRPLCEKRITENVDGHEISDQMSSLSEEMIAESSDSNEILDQMPTVTELQEAGVKFEKVGKIYMVSSQNNVIDNISLFDIKFDHGLMQIPCFKVDDSTDTIFRNLIAYEQHSFDNNLKYFTEFASFMDQLINTEKDVNFLRHKGIIVNLLGDDKEVSDIFNRLGEGLIISSPSYYSEVYKKVNTHCEKPLNEMMATLRGNYFNNPWASVSTVAAGVLLLLTLIQAIVALLTLFS